MSSSVSPSSGSAQRSTRAIIWVVLVVSLLVALAAAVSSVVAIATTATTGRLVTMLEAGHALPSAADSGPAVLEEGTYERASVVVSGLPGFVLVFDSVATAIGALTVIAVALAVAAVSWRMLRPEPFARRLSLTVSIVGGIVLIGSLLATSLHVIAAWMTAERLNDPAADMGGFWPIMATLDFAPLALGFGLMIVGLAFEYSERLQRDTAGLV